MRSKIWTPLKLFTILGKKKKFLRLGLNISGSKLSLNCSSLSLHKNDQTTPSRNIFFSHRKTECPQKLLHEIKSMVLPAGLCSPVPKHYLSKCKMLLSEAKVYTFWTKWHGLLIFS